MVVGHYTTHRVDAVVEVAADRIADHDLVDLDVEDVATVTMYRGKNFAKRQQAGHLPFFHDHQRADVMLDHQAHRLWQQRVRPDAENLAALDLENILDLHRLLLPGAFVRAHLNDAAALSPRLRP